MIFPANQTHTEASHLRRAKTMTEQRRKQLKYEIEREYPEGDEQSNSTLSRGRGLTSKIVLLEKLLQELGRNVL